MFQLRKEGRYIVASFTFKALLMCYTTEYPKKIKYSRDLGLLRIEDCEEKNFPPILHRFPRSEVRRKIKKWKRSN